MRFVLNTDNHHTIGNIYYKSFITKLVRKCVPVLGTVYCYKGEFMFVVSSCGGSSGRRYVLRVGICTLIIKLHLRASNKEEY